MPVSSPCCTNGQQLQHVSYHLGLPPVVRLGNQRRNLWLAPLRPSVLAKSLQDVQLLSWERLLCFTFRHPSFPLSLSHTHKPTHHRKDKYADCKCAAPQVMSMRAPPRKEKRVSKRVEPAKQIWGELLRKALPVPGMSEQVPPNRPVFTEPSCPASCRPASRSSEDGVEKAHVGQLQVLASWL